MPFLMSWPGTIPADTNFDHPVSTLDLVPTFVAAAGGTLPSDRTYDGVNLIPHLTHEIESPPHDTLFWKMQWGAAIRAGHWKLVRTPMQEHWLFDLDEDVSESNNVASSHPDVVSQLKHSLENWESTHPGPIWLIDQAWHARTLERYDQDVIDSFIRN